MPPTPIPSGYGIATVKLLRDGASAPDVVTFGYDSTTLNTADQEAALIGVNWAGAFTAASTLDSYTFVGVHVLRNHPPAMAAGDYTTSVAGTVAAAAASPAIAVRVTKKTVFAGRKYRGRMYLPPAYISEANIDAAGVIDAATLASLQTKLDNFLAAQQADNLDMYLLHADGSTPDEVTALVARSSVGTQRRRQALL